MEGWEQRRTSFGAVAADYAALRPTYPADVVGFLLGDAPRRVLDLGAGTGLLTDRLVAAGHEVVAVDLSGEMLAQLRERLPRVRVATGGAESIPLPDADVDAVVAGQAAHWFDVAPAAAELCRVLRPGGVVGLVWNTRDERVPWVRALGELLADEARDHEADQTVVARFAAELPADVEVLDSAVAQLVTQDEVVRGIGTRSYVATMDGARRAEFLGRVRELLSTHPDTRGRTQLELPYTTRAHRLSPR
ncbi:MULTISPECIES: class I SAM-dependent methyltransferase [unclassified Modestobacter]|uniref:class I SAM-dependent methyltransferase n=1 Tax=unclassified Modestobacter TaxID=2643866 RepID=UPI0022AA1483|nr:MULTISPECIES: class I SAM-dependent methyltransferase [unclassified Modestobacter]MCZ2825356.1 methyltransferase domain-containing protein [Modestobacter sp. VKM Ac-2981]MCZ2853579.1 methyltransferase domain-containing protein [Modestobacter sp. VKM Ac-2982]